MATAEPLPVLFEKGPWKDLMLAESGRRLAHRMFEHAEELEAAESWKPLFRLLSFFTTTGCLLALARMFEAPNKWYPQRTIQEALGSLEGAWAMRPTFPEYVRERLGALGVDASSVPEDKLAPLASATLRKALGAPEIMARLDSLKDFRDKAIAHNESYEPTPEQRETEIAYYDALLDLARSVVEIVGHGFFGLTGTLDDLDRGTSGDPERAVAELDRVLRAAGIVKD